MLERLFRLKENGTAVRTEVLAGLTTFLTMAYIILVNPQILAAAGMVTLASDFMEDLWPEVRDAMSECDTAPKATQLFASILREQGVDERAAKAVEDLGLLLDRRG